MSIGALGGCFGGLVGGRNMTVWQVPQIGLDEYSALDLQTRRPMLFAEQYRLGYGLQQMQMPSYMNGPLGPLAAVAMMPPTPRQRQVMDLIKLRHEMLSRRQTRLSDAAIYFGIVLTILAGMVVPLGAVLLRVLR